MSASYDAECKGNQIFSISKKKRQIFVSKVNDNSALLEKNIFLTHLPLTPHLIWTESP
jgi:hypothetical protein